MQSQLHWGLCSSGAAWLVVEWAAGPHVMLGHHQLQEMAGQVLLSL
jgi:hypothetical protein